MLPPSWSFHRNYMKEQPMHHYCRTCIHHTPSPQSSQHCEFSWSRSKSNNSRLNIYESLHLHPCISVQIRILAHFFMSKHCCTDKSEVRHNFVHFGQPPICGCYSIKKIDYTFTTTSFPHHSRHDYVKNTRKKMRKHAKISREWFAIDKPDSPKYCETKYKK